MDPDDPDAHHPCSCSSHNSSNQTETQILVSRGIISVSRAYNIEAKSLVVSTLGKCVGSSSVKLCLSRLVGSGIRLNLWRQARSTVKESPSDIR